MLKTTLIFHLLFIIAYHPVSSSTEEETEVEIKRKILAGYDTSIPAILYATKPHITYISLNILRIRGMDERKGMFIVEGALLSAWTDERLAWSTDTVNLVRVTSDQVWMPKLNVLNRIEADEITLDPLVIITKGIVWYGRRVVLRTACAPNLRYFPFDTQVCDVKCYYHDNYITQQADDLPVNYSSPEAINQVFGTTQFHVENIQWNLQHFTIRQEEVQIDEDTKQKIGIFTFTIERSMPLISLSILTPSVISVILLLSTFWMTAGNTARTVINVTSLLVSSTSLFTLGRILPVSGSVTPIIVEYTTVTLILSSISSFETILMSILSRCQNPPPIAYGAIIMKFPEWTLRLLGLAADSCINLDERFLFSELSDPDSESAREIEISKPTGTKQNYLCLWEKHIQLFDRLSFYVLGIVILLFIISVIITE